MILEELLDMDIPDTIQNDVAGFAGLLIVAVILFILFYIVPSQIRYQIRRRSWERSHEVARRSQAAVERGQARIRQRLEAEDHNQNIFQRFLNGELEE